MASSVSGYLAIGLTLAFGASTIGCGGGPTPLPSPSRVDVPAPASPAPSPPAVTTPLPGSFADSGADQQTAVDAALNDAAAHLGVTHNTLHLDRVEAHQWGDSSLGCPRPGVMYSQIVTPGYLIVVSSADTVLEYHSDNRGRVVLCQQQ